MSCFNKLLMRLTIQLKRRPYKVLATASLTSVAFSTVLGRIMVSPLMTTQWEVRASCSSSAWMQSKEAAEKINRCVVRRNYGNEETSQRKKVRLIVFKWHEINMQRFYNVKISSIVALAFSWSFSSIYPGWSHVGHYNIQHSPN